MENEKRNECAVSPVVGVMLMLVVTIIIAAVVSAYAGGIMSNQQKAPSATFECIISNDGSWGGSSFDLICLGTDEAIPTSDLRLVTSWTANGTSGGATITGPLESPNVHSHNGTGVSESNYTAPLGFGPGVDQWVGAGNYYVDQHWGNYSFMTGTSAHNSAYGFYESYGGYGVSPATRYQYISGSAFDLANNDVDAMMAILGDEWYYLMPGDTVHVKLVYTPTGSVIYDEIVGVEG